MPELTLKAIEQLLDAKFKQELQPIKTDIANIQSGMAKLATSEELRTTERRLMKHAEDLQAELARMVGDGFTDIQQRLDVRQRLERDEYVIKQLATKAGLTLDW